MVCGLLVGPDCRKDEAMVEDQANRAEEDPDEHGHTDVPKLGAFGQALVHEDQVGDENDQ